MKIGIVLPSVPGYSETFFTNKIKGLQAQGHEVILFVNANNAQSTLPCKIKTAPKLSGNFNSVFISSLWSLSKCLWLNFNGTAKLFREDKKDGVSFANCFRNIITSSHILCQKVDWLHFGFGTMALGRENLALAIGAQMAVSFRGFDHYVYPVKNKNCYQKLFQKEVKYHVLSEGMRMSLIGQGINHNKIKIITPAIDTDLFMKKPIETENNKIVQIITIARLHWIKGLEYTLEALKIIKERGVDFQYYIVGDGIEKERLTFAVHQLGLQENVIFLGKITPQEVKEAMEKASYYIQYSLQEGFCNAVLEAQAMGLVCIVSDAEGLSENVLDNETGFVVPKRNPELLASKIIEVLHISEPVKEALINKATIRIETNFTIEDQVKQFVDFYSSTGFCVKTN